MMLLPPQNEEDLRSIKKTKKYKETAAKSFFVVSAPPTEFEADLCAHEEAIALFEQRLPSHAQEQIIAGYVNREYPHGFLPPARVVKILAAKDWLRSQQSISVSATA